MESKNNQIDNSINAGIPKEKNLKEENSLDFTQTVDGVHPIRDDRELEIVIEAAKDITNRYRDALQELAK